ncbi:MAG: peptidoglycan editing factor PgeF [Peptococcaceae bacterium]|nr:peptidoglycan editing factor PgeF [Peptococcaceae bacterium]
MFEAKTGGGVTVYAIPAFTATGLVAHGFTARGGGVSKGPYASLNMAFHVGDRPGHVLKNREIACGVLGIESRKLVAGKQVHGAGIRVVTREDAGRGADSDDSSLPDTDALITAEPGLPLASFYADCVPLFFLDPVRKVAALAHAGWRGTALRIGPETVQVMAGIFGTDPRECLAGIGPSIGPCCYEVDQALMKHFPDRFSANRAVAVSAGPGKWFFNLWEANRLNLLEAGLKPENITVAGLCTACRNADLFSYRAQQGVCGRMAALIMLKE